MIMPLRKCIQINTVANWGSNGKIAENIGIEAKRNGWESYMAYGREKYITSELNLIRIGRKPDILIHGIMTRLFDRHGLHSTTATKNFLRRLYQLQPDIIHLHNIHGYYLNYPLLFQYLAEIRKPIIWTLHDCWPFTGHCAYFDFIKCNKWETQCYNCPYLHSYPKSLGFDGSHRNWLLKKSLFSSLPNVTIVAVSDWLANKVSKSFLNKYPIKVIHNGVDLSTFKPTPSYSNSCHDKPIRILGVANNWERRKGLNEFLELRRILPQNYEITLIGLSYRQIKKLPDGIIGMERTDKVAKLVSFYSNADIFVNPSLDDNFPLTNLEALACGTPVVTFQTGGCPEAIDNETGKAVEYGNINALKEAVINMGKPSEKVRMACRKRATRLFDAKNTYNTYINLYEEVSLQYSRQ